ncbi:hypothetical protein RFI_07414, partial [Reticulomyxa filosa]
MKNLEKLSFPQGFNSNHMNPFEDENEKEEERGEGGGGGRGRGRGEDERKEQNNDDGSDDNDDDDDGNANSTNVITRILSKLKSFQLKCNHFTQPLPISIAFMPFLQSLDVNLDFFVDGLTSNTFHVSQFIPDFNLVDANSRGRNNRTSLKELNVTIEGCNISKPMTRVQSQIWEKFQQRWIAQSMELKYLQIRNHTLSKGIFDWQLIFGITNEEEKQQKEQEKEKSDGRDLVWALDHDSTSTTAKATYNNKSRANQLKMAQLKSLTIDEKMAEYCKMLLVMNDIMRRYPQQYCTNLEKVSFFCGFHSASDFPLQFSSYNANVFIESLHVYAESFAKQLTYFINSLPHIN